MRDHVSLKSKEGKREGGKDAWEACPLVLGGDGAVVTTLLSFSPLCSPARCLVGFFSSCWWFPSHYVVYRLSWANY